MITTSAERIKVWTEVLNRIKKEGKVTHVVRVFSKGAGSVQLHYFVNFKLAKEFYDMTLQRTDAWDKPHKPLEIEQAIKSIHFLLYS